MYSTIRSVLQSESIMSDFKNNHLLPSNLLPATLLDNYRAKALVANTADNIFSSPDSETTIGYVGNYQDIFKFSVAYQYDATNKAFIKYNELFNSDLPQIIKFNKLYTSSLFDIIVKDNHVYNNLDIINITTFQDISSIQVNGDIEIDEVAFTKLFTPETITIKYLYDGKYIVNGDKSGLIGYCYNQIRFISDYISFTIRSDSTNPLNDLIVFKIDYNYSIDDAFKNSFYIVNIKSIYNLDTINPDKVTFYTPRARLNNIIPFYSSDNKDYKSFDNIIDTLEQDDIYINGMNKWGYMNGHVLSFPFNNDKFVNYSNYYWVGHLLPQAKSIPTDSSSCTWYDVRNIDLVNVDDFVNAMKVRWSMIYKPYLLCNCPLSPDNIIRVNLEQYGYKCDTTGSLIDASNIKLFYTDINNVVREIRVVYSYNYEDIINTTKDILAIGRQISTGLEFKIFNRSARSFLFDSPNPLQLDPPSEWHDSFNNFASFYDINCLGNTWIAAGCVSEFSSGGLYFSENGEQWYSSNITDNESFIKIYNNGSSWMVASTLSILYTSIDGREWIPCADQPFRNYVYPTIAGNGNLWIAGSPSGGGLKYSYNGSNWTDSNIINCGIQYIKYSNGMWIASLVETVDALGNKTQGGIVYSIDGLVWNNSNITSGSFGKCEYANGLYTITSNIGVYYSTDGKTWNIASIKNDDGTIIDFDTTSDFFSYFYCELKYVEPMKRYYLSCDYGHSYYSIDGKTWIYIKMLRIVDSFTIAYNDEYAIIGTWQGMFYSSDLVDWTKVDDDGLLQQSLNIVNPTNAPMINRLVYANYKFVAVGFHGSAYSNDVDEIQFDNVFVLFKTLDEYAPVMKKMYGNDIPQYYCNARSDVEIEPLLSPCLFNIEDDDWAQDNYWISGNNIYKHAEFYNYNVNAAIRALGPIIEFNKGVTLNTYYDDLTNLPCDASYKTAVKYYQKKTVSNQRPMFDIYSITDKYLRADCIFSYMNTSDIGNNDISISDIKFVYPNNLGDICFNNNGMLTPVYNIEVNTSPIYAIAYENNNIEPTQTIPHENGAWSTPEPLLSDIVRKRIDYFTYSDYLDNAKSLLYSNNVDGNIIQYNVGYEYLIANGLSNTRMLDIIDTSRDTYNNLLLSSRQFITEFLLKYITTNKILIQKNNELNIDSVYDIFKNKYVATLFRDKVQYNCFADLVQTLPIIGATPATYPKLVFNDILKMPIIECHDGHLQPYINISDYDVGNIINSSINGRNNITVDELYSNMFPVKIAQNEIWFNQKNATLYLFNVTSDNVYSSTTPPLQNTYDYWIDTANNIVNVFKNGSWINFVGDGIFYAANNDTVYRYIDNVLSSQIGKFSSIVEFNAEMIINEIILRIELDLYNTCLSQYISNNKYIEITNDNKYNDYMYDYFLEYCKSNKLNSDYTGFDAGDAFTWNYSSATLNAPVSGNKWYNIYQKLYNTVAPNKFPWLIINYTEQEFKDECEARGIQLFTVDMWNFIKTFVSYPISVNPYTNELLPPYVNNALPYAENALINIVPNGIADKVDFGGNGPLEYIWTHSINYKYDEVKSKYKINPLNFFKQMYGYPIFNKQFGNNKFEYCPYVNKKLETNNYIQYMDYNIFAQDYNASTVVGSDILTYKVYKEQGYIDDGYLITSINANVGDVCLLITNNNILNNVPLLSIVHQPVDINFVKAYTSFGNGYAIICDNEYPVLYFNNNGEISKLSINDITIINSNQQFITFISEGKLVLAFDSEIGSPCLIFDVKTVTQSIINTQMNAVSNVINNINNNISIEFRNDISINDKNYKSFNLLLDNVVVNTGYINYDITKGNNLIYTKPSLYNICLNIQQPTYYYHTKALITFLDNVINFKAAQYFRPIGIIQWVYNYNNVFGINRENYSKSVREWDVNIGFRTTGNIDSNNLNLIYNGKSLDSKNFEIIGSNVSNTDILRINSVRVTVAKIGRSIYGGSPDTFVPLEDGSDWVFFVESSDPIAHTITLYDLTDTNEYSTITPSKYKNIEFALFKSYDKIFTTKNKIIGFGVQALINILYGIHRYYEANNVTFIGGSYFDYMMQFLNLLYENGFAVGNVFKINPLGDGLIVDKDIGFVEQVSDLQTQSKTYLLDSINASVPLINYDIYRNHNETTILGVDLHNANLVYKSYDTVILFKNTELLSLVDLRKNQFPRILQVKLSRSKYTGRPSFAGKLLLDNGDLIDNVTTQIQGHENAFNVYSNDNDFAILRYSLYNYNDNMSALNDIGFNNSDIFRMMKDACRDQGTINCIEKVIENNKIITGSYKINETYLVRNKYITTRPDSDIFIFDSEIINADDI